MGGSRLAQTKPASTSAVTTAQTSSDRSRRRRPDRVLRSVIGGFLSPVAGLDGEIDRRPQLAPPAEAEVVERLEQRIGGQEPEPAALAHRDAGAVPRGRDDISFGNSRLHS